MKRFKDAPGAVEGDRDDINADEAVAVFGVGIEEGGDGMEDALRLDADDRFRRRAMPRLGAHADLDAEQNFTFEGDEIEFAAATMPVARDNRAARLFEREGGDSLAARPDRRIARGRLRHRAAMPVMPVGGSMIDAASSG